MNFCKFRNDVSIVFGTPEDRNVSGVARSLNIMENMFATQYMDPAYSGKFMLKLGSIQKRAEELVKEYRIVGVRPDGSEEELAHEGKNHQRLKKHAVRGCYQAIRLEVISHWGIQDGGIFAFEAEGMPG